MAYSPSSKACSGAVKMALVSAVAFAGGWKRAKGHWGGGLCPGLRLGQSWPTAVI